MTLNSIVLSKMKEKKKSAIFEGCKGHLYYNIYANSNYIYSLFVYLFTLYNDYVT
jgi:hypothetical protein